MKTLHSISSINHCYQTYGSRPVRVLCSDLEDYVCKYYTGGNGIAYNLFNEYLAASFLKIWKLPVPDFSVVTIAKKHMEGLGFPYRYFEVPCFGSKYLGNCKEVDKVFIGLPKNRFKNPESAMEYMMIALFDIWLCNEDRNHNNYNLLYDSVTNHFIPIDHVNIFNGLNIDKQPYLISENESILSSPLFPIYFYGTLQLITKDFRFKFKKIFNSHINICNESLNQILSDLPIQWQLDLPLIKEKVAFFFSEEWITDRYASGHLHIA
ncbi:MAG: HipA family kinase [Bacteroidota bacterium]